MEFEEDNNLGYYTAHMRLYDSEGNIILTEIHPQDILEETLQFIHDELEHFIETNAPVRINGNWRFSISAPIMYEM